MSILCSVHITSQIGKSILCLLLGKFVLRLSKHRTTTWMNRARPHVHKTGIRSRSTLANAKHFKARGSYSHSISCMGMCCRWGKCPVSVFRWHNPSQNPTEYLPPGFKKERQTSQTSIADIVNFLGYSSSHMTSLTWRHWLKMTS